MIESPAQPQTRGAEMTTKISTPFFSFLDFPIQFSQYRTSKRSPHASPRHKSAVKQTSKVPGTRVSTYRTTCPYICLDPVHRYHDSTAQPPYSLDTRLLKLTVFWVLFSQLIMEFNGRFLVISECWARISCISVCFLSRDEISRFLHHDFIVQPGLGYGDIQTRLPAIHNKDQFQTFQIVNSSLDQSTEQPLRYE